MSNHALKGGKIDVLVCNYYYFVSMAQQQVALKIL